MVTARCWLGPESFRSSTDRAGLQGGFCLPLSGASFGMLGGLGLPGPAAIICRLSAWLLGPPHNIEGNGTSSGMAGFPGSEWFKNPKWKYQVSYDLALRVRQHPLHCVLWFHSESQASPDSREAPHEGVDIGRCGSSPQG